MDNRTIEELRRNEDRLIKENENLKAQIDLHCGALKREHEAIKRLSELEEESAKLLKQNEFNTTEVLEYFNELKNQLNALELEFDYESLKLYQQSKEDLLIEIKSQSCHVTEDTFYFLQRLEENINYTLFEIDCKLKQLYKLGCDVNEC